MRHPSRRAPGCEAKFSVRTVAAMALLGYDTSMPGSFNEQVAQADDIVALRARITVEGRDDIDVAESRAAIELRNGHVLEAVADERRADRDPERRRVRTRAKFAALTAPYLSAQSADELEARIFALETAGVVNVRP